MYLHIDPLYDIQVQNDFVALKLATEERKLAEMRAEFGFSPSCSEAQGARRPRNLHRGIARVP